ncbi:AN1-type zinc finger protein 2A-like [Ischnura elegans]|uniref:AN1-type zinc finger protein 2A-like n=1 Tax=Ischnura elegans TaxID=197161 RepID=UPI001ED8BBA4|nr:AN1-type zinc finger protein 2A-like [Ischnura elegans]XP_046394676.1 AN1-type zinc finger protein 2A-like [Ischnura elegans]XP_046394677.1 AN1-type zinc finger protein 2A-like [Ischnura elegans]
MEFPHLGKNCHHTDCHKLDFLPMKCDACDSVFCHEHFSYRSHECPSAYQKDVQVPVCPLCNVPVPFKRGQLPDIAVGAHIDNDCQSDPACSRRKVFTNRCNVKNCKQKELVPVQCRDCKLNYCLKHRHPQDHQCKPPQGKPPGKAAGEAALARIAKASSSSSSRNSAPRAPPPPSAIQGQMSEDEALSRALAASLADNKRTPNQANGLTLEEEDEMLARAIAESEREQQQGASHQLQSPRETSKERCAVS